MYLYRPIGWGNTKLAPTTGKFLLQPPSCGLMQEDYQQEPLILRDKLLQAVDADSNVRDVPLILEVLGKLESLPVTKEVLESTRLGKTVNDLRRKVKDAVLARRLKYLVKKWRDAVLVDPPQAQNHVTVNGASSGLEDGGLGLGGNRHHLISGYTSASSSPTLASSRVSPAGSYNSNSLSPRIVIERPTNFTNYSNTNNTSAHSLPASRNGSSSIANRSPNNHHHKNLQISSSTSFSKLVSPSASSNPHLISRSLSSPHKSKSPGGPILTAFSNTNVHSPLPSSQLFQSTSSSYAPYAENVPSLSTTTTPAEKPPVQFIDWGDSDDESEVKRSAAAIASNTEGPSPLVQIKSESVSPAAVAIIPEEEIDSQSHEEIIDDSEGLSTASAIPFHRGDDYVVQDEEVESYIKDNLPNVNGNYDKDGVFREWHETLTVESYKQEPLHILPYTIIDF